MREIKKGKCGTMQLLNGRPQNCEDRLLKEIKCYDFLDKLNINYLRVDHNEADNMEICSEIEKVLGAKICKNLFLCNRQETQFYLLMMPANKPFKTKDLSKQIESSRLSFASSENMEKYLNITPGSVSVLGLMNDRKGCVKLLVDDDLLKQEYIGVHPSINTSSLKIKTEDVFETIVRELNHPMTVVSLPDISNE